MPDAFLPSQWAQIQDYESQIARILEMRKQPQPPKRWYESSTWVGSVTAIITLVLTSVTSYVNQGRELRLSHRTTHAAAMRDAAIEAHTLLGTMLKANEERLLLAQGKMDPLPRPERDSISRNTNAIQQRWRNERERAAILVYLYAGPQVAAEWDTVRLRLDDYTQCGETVYRTYARTFAPDTVCAGPKARTIAAGDAFKKMIRERLLAVEEPE